MDEWEGRCRIAMFTNVYLPTTNGVVVSVETFRKALTKLGHDVFIFGPSSGNIPDRAPFIFRYPAFELPMQKYPLAVPVSPYIDHLLENLKPQVLHANHPALLGRVALRKSEELDLPLVYTYHTRYDDYAHYAEPLPQESVKEFIHHWLASFMSHCHHVVVPSESIRDILVETYGLLNHVSVVPTGIDTVKFSSVSREDARGQLGWSDDYRYLISMGRLAKEKNFHVLLEAFRLLEREDTRLVIIGSGDEEEELKTLARRLGVGDKVVFTGLVSFDRVPVYLAAGDYFTFASVTETQGLVTLEAMASGLPVAAVDASGTREAVAPECSVLTAEAPEALAKGMEELLSRENWSEMSRSARERAAKFGLIPQGKAMLEVYEKAIETHARGARALVPEERVSGRWAEFISLFGM